MTQSLKRTDLPSPQESFWGRMHRLVALKSQFLFSDGTRMTYQEAVERGLILRPFRYKYVSDPFAGANRQILVIDAHNQAEADAMMIERVLNQEPLAIIIPEWGWTSVWNDVPTYRLVA